jgi:hypothetical protein
LVPGENWAVFFPSDGSTSNGGHNLPMLCSERLRQETLKQQA